MCICICLFVFVYLYLCICILLVYLYLKNTICVFVYLYIYIFVYLCICICVFMFVYLFLFICVFAFVYMCLGLFSLELRNLSQHIIVSRSVNVFYSWAPNFPQLKRNARLRSNSIINEAEKIIFSLSIQNVKKKTNQHDFQKKNRCLYLRK